jgi:hypothetical protein
MIDDHHGHVEVDSPVPDPAVTPWILGLPCEVCGRPISAHMHFEVHGR